MASEFPEYFHAFGPQINTFTSVGILLVYFSLSYSNLSEVRHYRFKNTNSDLKMHGQHYVNELLVRVRLSFQNFLQTRQIRKNKKLSTTDFGYD